VRLWSLLLPDEYDGPIRTLAISDDGMLAVQYEDIARITIDFDALPGLVTPVMCREVFVKADKLD